jgi:hypothetical protein
MKAGFTGTREGLTPLQEHTLKYMFSEHNFNEFHHGDCVGADLTAHKLVRNLGGIRIIVHPPINNKHRGYAGHGYEIRDPKPYGDRNQGIVDACDILFACPKGEEILRSGTWQTIRFARKANKKVIIIYPDGSTEIENNPL